ncbi:MAG: hypothetical protein ACO36E_05595 [Synechocystis sp.]
MNKVWLGGISLGLGAFLFCANFPTDLGFFQKLYLVIFASKATFLTGYFLPGFLRKQFLTPSLSPRSVRFPWHK